jgi:hypothetical protein
MSKLLRSAAAPAAVAHALFLGAAGVAAAQVFPEGRDSGFNERDEVTGYLCVTPGCDVLRMPGIDCICTKQNPNERRLSRLRLSCSTKKAGEWIACPARPRHGIPAD